jgi:hypothetical protein
MLSHAPRGACFTAPIVALVLAWSSAAGASQIDILGNHGVSDPAPSTIVNATDSAGTTNMGDFTNRGANNLLDDALIGPGTPYSQAAQMIDPSQAYWNSQQPTTRGDVGILLDLGAAYALDALQLFGYNITDGSPPGAFADRTPGSFSIWTATDSTAVTTAGGNLLVNDISKFTQQGSIQSMSNPGANPTPGETFLFGGASQPPEVGGATHAVTAASVEARYLFLRELTPIETSSLDLNIVGLGEIQAYGTPVPEPSTLVLAGLTALGLSRLRRRPLA